MKYTQSPALWIPLVTAVAAATAGTGSVALGAATASPVAPDADGDVSAVARTVGRAEAIKQTVAAGTARLSDPCDGLEVGDFMATAVGIEGDTPSEIHFTPDGARMVIAHRDSMNLVLLDAATRAVVDTIPVSGSPNSLAISSDGVHAVTANLFENTVSIIDLSTGLETDVVPVGTQPGVVRITPDGATAIVGNTIDSTLSVVDIATATELRQIAGANFGQVTSFGSWAITYRFTDYVITSDSATVIMADLFNDALVFFHIATGTNTAIATQPDPFSIDQSPDGTTAVMAHSFPTTGVSVIDVAGESITSFIPTGASATSAPPIAINPAKTKAVVAVQNNVRVVDLVAGTTSGDLFTGSPNALETTPDGLYVVVGNFSGSLVSFASETIVGNFLSTTTPDGLAVSPVGSRAATIHALRKEDVEVMNVNGAAGFLEGVVPSGPPPEGDKARGVALTSDGATAVVINNHSKNATIIDTASGAVLDAITVGERPGGVAITPDDTTAVVANLDSTFVSVIDLGTSAVTNIAISRRGSAVVISPDGQYAYIPVVASGDGVWRVNLNTLAVDGAKILTGEMGGIGYVFDLASGIALSHDGATLAVCGSFDDNLSIIDTASWTEVARVAVGDFPTRAAFSPDDSTIYVSCKFDDTVTEVSNAGAASIATDIIPVLDQPFELLVNAAGDRLYVSSFGDKAIQVFARPGNGLVDTIFLPLTNNAGQPVGLHLKPDDTCLYVAANGADFHGIDTATNTISATVNTGLAPAQLAFDDVNECGYTPTPFGGDGLAVVCVVNVCTCPADITGPDAGVADGNVDALDFLLLIAQWGSPCIGSCEADITGPTPLVPDGNVDSLDFLLLIAQWGSPSVCP